MKHAKRVEESALLALGRTIRVVLARRLRLRMRKSRHGHHSRRRHSYSTFMMEQMNARSIF